MAEDVNTEKKEIGQVITAYPQEKRYVLAMMQDLQKKYHYLSRESLEMVAEHTGIPFSKVYSMATFYKAFSLVPKGCYHLRVCDGTACHIKASAVLIDQVYSTLGIRPGETTPDVLFSLETVNCLGACALAPVLMVNETVHPKVTSSTILDIIEKYRRDADEADA